MKKYYILITFIFIGCSTFKDRLLKKGDKNDVIKNAIIDFSHTSRLYKNDRVFSIYLEDLEEKVVVTIIRKVDKILLKNDTKIGDKGKLPSRYYEINGKLFIWWDNDLPLTADVLNKLKVYNVLQFDKEGVLRYSEISTDEYTKGVHYFFCKKNISKYKKVTTNVAYGWYSPPKLNCD